MSKWLIEQKEDDFLDGEQVYRVSIGGSQRRGFYLIFRGDAKEIAPILHAASFNFARNIEGLRTDLSNDDLAKDLLQVVHNNLGSPEDYKPLLEALTILAVSRDHKVFNAGVTYGQQLERGDIDPEEEQ